MPPQDSEEHRCGKRALTVKFFFEKRRKFFTTRKPGRFAFQFLPKARADDVGFAVLSSGLRELRRYSGNPRALQGEVETDRLASGNNGFEDFLKNSHFAGVSFCCMESVLNGFENAFYVGSRDDSRKLGEIEAFQRHGFESDKRLRHQNFFRRAEVDLDEVLAFGVCAGEDAFEIGCRKVEVFAVKGLSDARAAFRRAARTETTR
jgi:hypothetical protein